MVLFDVGGPDDQAAGVATRFELKTFADALSYTAVVLRVGQDFVGDDDFFDGGEIGRQAGLARVAPADV